MELLEGFSVWIKICVLDTEKHIWYGEIAASEEREGWE